MKNKVREYFSEDTYEIIMGHTMPLPGYRYIEDDSGCTITGELMTALFKLHMTEVLSDEERYADEDEEENTVSRNHIEDVLYSFDDSFGCFDDEEWDDFSEWADNLEAKDIILTAKEKKAAKEFLKYNAAGCAEFEKGEYSDEFEDEDVLDAIENDGFLMVFSTLGEDYEY